MWQYNPTPSSDELYHYGVKGMKWRHAKHYSDNLFGHSRTIGSETTYTPGQSDKMFDKMDAKSAVRNTVNKTNPYKWNSNRSVQSNVKRNANTFKRRRKLKKVGYKAVDALFRHL